MFDYYFFDLDGTLTDSGDGITNSVAYALRKSGRPVPGRDLLNRFIGPPLSDSFMKYCGMTEEEALQAISFYREYYAEKGIFENRVYDGVKDLLEELKKRDRRLIVATSKPEKFTGIILRHFGLSGYFDFFAGATMDEKRTRKKDVIAYALDRLALKDRSAAIMIGDRENDIYGARENGLKSVGVLYGYGSEKELRDAGADYIVPTPAGIAHL